MFEQSLHICFLSDWQVSSGFGDGYLADSVLVRDESGLPVLPGRAVKGALREGAWRLALGREDLAHAENFFWGGRSQQAEGSAPGRLRVSPGLLPAEIRAELLAYPLAERTLFVKDMTCRRVQTALDARGMVQAHTLRTLECGIAGLCFEAQVEIYAPEVLEPWLRQYLQAVCAAVKSMGGNRARGFGQCRILCGQEQGVVTLPPPCPFVPTRSGGAV